MEDASGVVVVAIGKKAKRQHVEISCVEEVLGGVMLYGHTQEKHRYTRIRVSPEAAAVIAASVERRRQWAAQA